MNKIYSTVRKILVNSAGVTLLALLLLFSRCTDDVGDQFTTFEGELISSFLEKDPDSYSEFSSLLKSSGIFDLLNAYGSYTCFAPTNKAMQTYYAEKGVSPSDLSQEEIREIVFNHIIPQKLESSDFEDGVISSANMNDRYISLTYSNSQTGTQLIYVNGSSPITIIDQLVQNGVIHTVGKVLELSKVQLPEVIAADSRFSLFYEALVLTGMADSIRLMVDESYEQQTGITTNIRGATNLSTPPTRKYGFTVFMESDSLLATSVGIRTVDDLKAYAARVYDEVYPEDKAVSDYTDRRNSLNRFVSYHIVDKMLYANEFITTTMQDYAIPNTVLYEYMETLCPNTLMEVQSGNLFNKRKDGTAIRILTKDHVAQNGIYHEIDRIMVYDKGMEEDVLNKRIRMDVASLMPELMNNKLRGAKQDGSFQTYVFLPGYFKNMSFTEASDVVYWGSQGWRNYQGDEILVGGKYDFTLRIPPVPAGTYQVRLGYIANSSRGVAQIYVDGEAAGIPLDMTILASNPLIGWEKDANTTDNGVENDKMMRNRGYLKGPNTIWYTNKTDVLRNYNESLRRILVTKTFDKAEPHTLRIKSVEELTNREFHLDYIELVPSSYWDKEGRD